MQNSLEIDLQTARRSILERFEAIDTPKSIVNFQAEIAELIGRAQALRKSVAKREREVVSDHIDILRSYVDGLAWVFLNAYSLRQLGKNDSPGEPEIGSEAFNHVLASARIYAEQSIPVLIADLTHIVRIGDLILCANDEKPVIVECKLGGNPKFMMQARRGRQVSRAFKIARLLHDGVGRLYGDDKTSITIETSVCPEHCWDVLDECVRDALSNGQSFRIINADQTILAKRQDFEAAKAVEEVRHAVESYKQLFVACHLRVLDDIRDLIAPPCVWPISTESKWALMEGGVMLTHLVDVEALTRYSFDEGCVASVNCETESKPNDYPFTVRLASGAEQQFSDRFLVQLLYGFELVESVARFLVHYFAEIVKKKFPEPESKSDKKPSLTVVNTLEEALAVKETESTDGEGFVCLPVHLLQTLYENAKQRNPNIREDFPAIITDIRGAKSSGSESKDD